MLEMVTKTDQYIDSLTADGEISFTVMKFCNELGITRSAGLSALERLKKQNKIISPSKGYYLILTPEFRNKGCLPADFFIDDLMRYFDMDYYVSLLSAALYYGAAHQQPQMLQVMIPDRKRNIQCAKVTIEFIKNIAYDKTPIKKIKTRTGYMNVSTPEATAMDMMKYIRQSGGMNRIITVLEELAETMDSNALHKLAIESQEHTWIHRLGFLLDRLGEAELAASLHETLNKNRTGIIPLAPYDSMKGKTRNKKWQIAINAIVESDLDDSY